MNATNVRVAVCWMLVCSVPGHVHDGDGDAAVPRQAPLLTVRRRRDAGPALQPSVQNVPENRLHLW